MKGHHSRVTLLVTALALTYLLGWVPSALAAPPPASFADSQFLTVGSEPTSVAVGDFNKDGKADLVTANGGSNNVSVLIAKGDGTFAAHVEFAVGSAPQSVAVGDFNRDGKPDLATANYESRSVSVLLGDGSGGFAPHVDYHSGTCPQSVAVGDLNGDGVADLATANEGSDNVSVLLGKGSSGFAAHVDFAVGSPGTWPFSVAVGDFNKDGKPDLATANFGSDNVSVLLGKGNGGFAAHVDYDSGPCPCSVAVGDFNGDGVADLVTADFDSSYVSLLLGNGDGTFAAHVEFAVGSEPQAVAVGDFNGDGVADLATADFGSNDVSILLGNGDGTFAAQVDFAVGNGPMSVAMGDFNKDGRPDLAVANLGDNDVSVLLNTMSPTITLTAPTAASVWPAGSTRTVSWKLNTPVSGGEFRIWLIDAAGHWYLSRPVTPVVGKKSYSQSVKLSVPAGAGYKAAVYWRADPSVSTWQSRAKSAAFVVPPKVAITSPAGGEYWARGSTHAIRWKLNSPVSSGQFRLWLVSAAGHRYLNKPVTPVAGKKSYSHSVKLSVPAGSGCRAYVYWRADPAVSTWQARAKSNTFTVTP